MTDQKSIWLDWEQQPPPKSWGPYSRSPADDELLQNTNSDREYDQKFFDGMNNGNPALVLEALAGQLSTFEQESQLGDGSPDWPFLESPLRDP